MTLTRLGGIHPGRVGVFAGSLSLLPAGMQRKVAAEMETLGYGTLWYGESHAREPFAQGAIFLGATQRLVVATGIANIWVRDPTAMAAGGRTLAEAWPGRFILGIGVSHRPMVFSRGHQYARPVTAMREYIGQMRTAAWRGPETPIPPIVLAALGPRMVELGRDETAGVYPYFTTAKHIASVREQLGPEPFLAADLPVVLAPDRRRAREIGNRHTTTYLSVENYRNNLLRLGWQQAALEPPGSDELFDAVVAWGDVAQAGERAQALFQAGADQVVLNLVSADPRKPYLEELEALAPLARL